MKNYLAVDIGASSGRHILGSGKDGKITLEEVYRFENSQVRQDGHDCWDIDALVASVKAGIDAALAKGPVESIGLDTWGVDFVLLDEKGERCSDAVAYRDARTANADTEIEAEVREGGFNEALKYALHANAEHGLRRTNADKWHALEVAWGNREGLFKAFLGQDKHGKANGLPSSTQLAKMTGVTQAFAAKFIREQSENESAAASDEDESAVESEGVKANLAKGLDRFGVAIPEKLLPAFKGVADVRKMSRDVRALRNSLEERFKSNDLAFAAVPQQALINLDNAMHEIKSGQAYCVCRGCSGTGCYRCSDHGFQTGAQYRKMPEEYKAKEA